MFNWILNKLGRAKPQVGEVWEVNGPGRQVLLGRIVKVSASGVKIEVGVPGTDVSVTMFALHSDFKNILKIRKISNG